MHSFFVAVTAGGKGAMPMAGIGVGEAWCNACVVVDAFGKTGSHAFEVQGNY